MTTAQDCTQLRREHAGFICNDFMTIVASLLGFSEILKLQLDPTHPNSSHEKTSEIFKMIFDGHEHREWLFSQYLNILNTDSSIQKCSEWFADIRMKTLQIYETDFKNWNLMCEKLHTQFIDTGELDSNMIDSLVAYAQHVRAYREWMYEQT